MRKKLLKYQTNNRNNVRASDEPGRERHCSVSIGALENLKGQEKMIIVDPECEYEYLKKLMANTNRNPKTGRINPFAIQEN
jgi:hypothetical protein